MHENSSFLELNDALEGHSPSKYAQALRKDISSPNNLFLSHAWDTDQRGRRTHERVKMLKHELDKHGWKLWFDEEQLLIGINIDMKMASGIQNADAVCVCITRRYIEKINAQSQNDNCAKEWNFAQSTGKRILPLIMEQDMLDIRSWPQGLMTMYLGNTFYIDCSSDDIKSNAKKLSDMLTLLGLKKRKIDKTYSWPLIHKKKRIHTDNIIIRSKSQKNIQKIIRL